MANQRITITGSVTNPSAVKGNIFLLQINEDLIYSKKASKIDLIENGDNFLLYNIDNQYDQAPDLNDEIIKGEIVELIYQKGKFDYNREIIEEIQKKKFDNSKFEELVGSNKKYSSINSIESVSPIPSILSL